MKEAMNKTVDEKARDWANKFKCVSSTAFYDKNTGQVLVLDKETGVWRALTQAEQDKTEFSSCP